MATLADYRERLDELTQSLWEDEGISIPEKVLHDWGKFVEDHPDWRVGSLFCHDNGDLRLFWSDTDDHVMKPEKVSLGFTFLGGGKVQYVRIDHRDREHPSSSAGVADWNRFENFANDMVKDYNLSEVVLSQE